MVISTGKGRKGSKDKRATKRVWSVDHTNDPIHMYIVIGIKQGNSLSIFLKEWIEDMIRTSKISFLYWIIFQCFVA